MRSSRQSFALAHPYNGQGAIPRDLVRYTEVVLKSGRTALVCSILAIDR